MTSAAQQLFSAVSQKLICLLLSLLLNCGGHTHLIHVCKVVNPIYVHHTEFIL